MTVSHLQSWPEFRKAVRAARAGKPLAVVTDFETRSVLDLPKVGAAKYAEHPSTDIWCACFTFDGKTVLRWVPGDPVPAEIIGACADPDCLFVAHNAGFERTLWPLLTGRYGWPVCPAISRWRCTQAAALALALPPSLGKLAKALGLQHQKAADAIMHVMAKPRRPRGDEDPAGGPYWHDDEKHRQELYAYCAADVLCEWELFEWLVPLIPAEQALWCLDQVINDRGFPTDGKLIDIAIALTKTVEAEIADKFYALTGLSPNQVAKVRDWLAAHGCEVTDLQKATLAAALRRKDLTPEAKRAIELRRAAAHASANKFPALRAWRCLDGRVRGTFNFHKAATGRWSAGGPQPQNFAREVDDIEARFAAVMSGDIEIVRTLGDPLEIIGSISRAAICAAPGCKLLHADYSAIESRVLAWITDETAKLDLWARYDETQDPNDDPYVIIGRRLGFPEEEARARGKRADLAFGYGGGIGAYWGFAPDDDPATDEQITAWKLAWREQHPQTRQFWYGIGDAAVEAVRSSRPVRYGRFTLQREELHGIPFLFIELPSQRRLAYPFVKLVRDDHGRAAVSFMDNSEGGWQPCGWKRGKDHIWGGVFTENLVQAVARDRLATSMRNVEAAGFPIILHMHDSVCCEVSL
jgi:DNA polymerase